MYSKERERERGVGRATERQREREVGRDTERGRDRELSLIHISEPTRR